jgi:hypothetical protein
MLLNSPRRVCETDKEAQMSVQTFALLESLKHIEIVGHQRAESLEVFNLRWPSGDGLNYTTLDEALEANAIEVVESTEAGQVSRIKIINRSEQMVFLMGRRTASRV